MPRSARRPPTGTSTALVGDTRGDGEGLAHGDAAGLGSATFGPKRYETLARGAGFLSFRRLFGNGVNNFYVLAAEPPDRPGRL